jgi:hypothetical protein
MNAPLARHRSERAAYPFIACMFKQALVIAGISTLFGAGLLAGIYATTTWPDPGNWIGTRQPVEIEVLGKLTSELALTPEQVGRIQPIIQMACADMREASEEGRAERLAVLDEIGTTISPALNADQQHRIETLEAEWQARTPQKRQMRIVALY